MRFQPLREPTMAALGWRLLFGPAQLLEGIVTTLTLCTVNTGVVLKVARRLSMARLRSNN